MTKGRESDMKKLSPESLAKKVLLNLDSDTFEIRLGQTKVVLFINRFLPSLAEKIAKKR